MTHKQDRRNIRMLADKPAHRIRVPSRCQYFPDHQPIPYVEHFSYKSRSLLCPEERACSNQVEPEILRSHPAACSCYLFAPLLRQPAVCITHTRPGVLRFSMP